MSEFELNVTPSLPGKGPQVTVKAFVDPKSRKKIINVYPHEFTVMNNHGAFVIPAKPADKPYSYLEVGPGWSKFELGEGRYQSYLDISAEKIAEDVIHDPQYKDRGLFVPAGDEPTEEELLAAIERRNKWLARQLEEGDSTWARTQNPALIPTPAKVACEILGLKREWATGTALKGRVDCPACGEAVKPGVAICSHCGAILDEKKAQQFKLGPFKQSEAAKAAVGTGR